jgi:hypothetical protein
MDIARYKRAPEPLRRAPRLRASALSDADDAERLALSRRRAEIASRLSDPALPALPEPAFDGVLLWLLGSGVSDPGLRAFDLIPPAFCAHCLERARCSSSFAFVVHALTLAEALARADPARFAPGLAAMGAVPLAQSLLAADPQFLCTALNLFSAFLAPGDAAAAALVRRHIRQAAAQAQAPAAGDAEIGSALFFIESAFAARLATEKHARLAAECLIACLQLRYPHPALFRICYSLCAMIDQFPAHVMAFGQTRVLLILTQYLAEPALEPDSVAAAVCVFQRLFFHADAHSVYLYADDELFPRLLALVEFPSWLVRKVALRTLAIALQGNHGMAAQMLAALPVLERTVDAPFAFVRESADFLILLLECLPLADAEEAFERTAVVRLLEGADDFREEQAVRLGLAIVRHIISVAVCPGAIVRHNSFRQLFEAIVILMCDATAARLTARLLSRAPVAHTRPRLPRSSMSFSAPPPAARRPREAAASSIAEHFAELRSAPACLAHWHGVATRVLAVSKDRKRLRAVLPHIPLDFVLQAVVDGDPRTVRALALAVLSRCALSPDFPVDALVERGLIEILVQALPALPQASRLDALSLFGCVARRRPDVRYFLLADLVLERIPGDEKAVHCAKTAFVASCLVSPAPLPPEFCDWFEALLEDFMAADDPDIAIAFLSVVCENPAVVWEADALFGWVFARLAEGRSAEVCQEIIRLTNAAERVLGAAAFAARLPPEAHIVVLSRFSERFACFQVQSKVLKCLIAHAHVFGALDTRPLMEGLIAALPAVEYRLARLMCRALMAYSAPGVRFDPRVPAVVAPYALDSTLSAPVLTYLCALLRAPLCDEAHAAVIDVVEGIVDRLEAEDGVVGHYVSELLGLVDAHPLASTAQ